MRYVACALLVSLCAIQPDSLGAQSLHFPSASTTDSALLDAEVARLARALLGEQTDAGTLRQRSDRVRLHLAVGDASAALVELDSIRARTDAPGPEGDPSLVVLEMQARAMRATNEGEGPFHERYTEAFRRVLGRLADRPAHEVAWYLETPAFVFSRNLEGAVRRVSAHDSLSVNDAMAVVRSHVLQRSMAAVSSELSRLLQEDRSRRYITDTAVVIRASDGAELTAVMVRPRSASGSLPTTLNFTIYVDVDSHEQVARTAASYGYVGVVANPRGKRHSRDSIRPYETELDDTHAVLDWIAAQPWSDGRVGMYGGSYDGFAAWAATKRKHPALRTIATSVAAMPGLGLPMENNVFLNANYAWPFFVANDRLLDHATYGDRERWQSLPQRWYESGRAYREIDQVDGTPNPLLQRWLAHPSYDAYWQRMVPFGTEFADIDIPVLSITGYFDDGQISALEYVREHLRHRPNAEHYLVIGPYDHFSASAARKPTELRGYTLDSAAHFNGTVLTFAWFDHVFHGAPRPALLRDRINHQVMGANAWRHASRLDSMGDAPLRLFIAGERTGAHYGLTPDWPTPLGEMVRVANLADRSTEHTGYYPSEVVGREASFGDALTFVSEPFSKAIEVSGTMSGVLHAAINTQDFDFNVVLYELMPDGALFHLSYYLGRASYARDMTTRQLLTPGAVTEIPFERSRMTSRRLAVGSRLLLVVDVNKDAMHQVNHGTGRDVRDEIASDATEPLVVRLMPGSYFEVPVRKVKDGGGS